jgi:hypothetical protein
MIAFIDESREVLGVEPICKALQFAPSSITNGTPLRAALSAHRCGQSPMPT